MVFLEALDLPAMTPAVLALFAARGVVTVEDFLIHKVHELSVAAEQTSESDELKERCRDGSCRITILRQTALIRNMQAIAEVLSYLDSLQSGWCNGFDFSQKETRILSMGLSSFDDLLLQGSLQEGTITELVGSSSTGKTQICMQAAASIAYRLHCSVIYVDTCNAFSSQRVAHMLGGHLGSLLKVEEQRSELAHAMKNIQRIGLFEIYSVLAFLQDLNVYLQSTSEISQLRLLIVDSVSSVISPILGGNNVQGHALMVSVGQTLKKLAALNKIAVLCTNHTVAGNGGQPKPALGESWKSVPNRRFMLSRQSSSDIFTMSLVKHTSMACNKQAVFRIGRAGLQTMTANDR